MAPSISPGRCRELIRAIQREESGGGGRTRRGAGEPSGPVMVSGGGNARGSASRISGKSKKGAQRWNEKEREVSSTDSAGRPRRWGVSGRRHWHRLLGARVAAAGPRAIAAGRQAARRGLERACATDDCRRAHGASAARGSQTLVSILAALSATYTDLTNLDECGTDDGGGGVGGTLNRPDAGAARPAAVVTLHGLGGSGPNSRCRATRRRGRVDARLHVGG